MSDSIPVPTWPELIILMCFGESEEPPFTGVVEVEGDDEDDDDDHGPPLAQTVRVHKSGARYRVESLDGEPLFIKGTDRSWQFTPGRDVPHLIIHEDVEDYERGSYGEAVERPDPTNWRGNDFTMPTGPARETVFLGRAAWEVEIAPPPHKPAPITLVVDASTGMQLRWGNELVRDAFRWIAIEHGVALSDDLFEWDGDYSWVTYGGDPDMPDEIRDAIDRDEAERASQLATMRLPNLRLELSAPAELHAVEEDGTAHISYELTGWVTVQRRPHSDAPWDDVGRGETTTWTDGAVDWFVRAADGVAPEQIAEIRRQLSEPRPTTARQQVNDDEVPPAWIELLVRMCAGESAEPPFIGVLEVHEDDDGGRWPLTVRVFKDRDRYRVEDLDGRLLTIRQSNRTYVFRDDGEPPARYDDEPDDAVRHGAYGDLIQRRLPTDWRGDDFTAPAGPVGVATWLGRPAWEVALKPPGHKPSALILTVDPFHGMVVEQRTDVHGVLSRWTEITEVDSHPQELFEWTGDADWYTSSYSEHSPEDEEEERRQNADDRTALGLPLVAVAVDLDLQVYQREETGEFQAGFHTRVDGHVLRRPRSAEPWDIDDDFEHVERWSDDAWDWCVASDEGVAHLADIRRQLSEPRPDGA